MPTIQRKRTKADQRREQQRRLLFADVPDGDLWSHTNQGWCWTPRTMPHILHAIRAMTKGSNAAEAYLALWCHSVSESIVEMRNKASMISAAGYSGPTSERTWKERIRKLEELGFIRVASGVHGDISTVLLLNPHKVLRDHKEKGTPGFDDKIFNCILDGIAEFGMTDFTPPKQVTASPPPAPRPPTLRQTTPAPSSESVAPHPSAPDSDHRVAGELNRSGRQ